MSELNKTLIPGRKPAVFRKPHVVAGKISNAQVAQNVLVRSGYIPGLVGFSNPNLVMQPCSAPAQSKPRPEDFFSEEQALSQSSLVSAFNNMMGFTAIKVDNKCSDGLESRFGGWSFSTLQQLIQ
jgi:hypothetical protein